MNMNFLNHKHQRREVSYVEGEDNVVVNLKEVYNKVNLIEKLLLDEEGVIDNLIKTEKRLDDFIKIENDSLLVVNSRLSRVESKFFDLDNKIKNNDLNLIEEEKKEEEEEEELIDSNPDNVLNVTPNPVDDITPDADDIKIDN